MGLLEAEYVRLWMVDDKTSQIWEWHPGQVNPVKRSYWEAEPKVDTKNMFKKGAPPLMKLLRTQKAGIAADVARTGVTINAGIAADVARTGVTINVPFPAVQSSSFSIEIDRLPDEQARTIICEPIRYHGEIVAVVQCYNKSGDPEEAHFSPMDEILIGVLAHHCGGAMRNCMLHQEVMSASKRALDLILLTGVATPVMSASKRALNVIRLTHHYPCDSKDLYFLASVFFDRTRELIDATHCTLWIASSSLLGESKTLWATSPDGHGDRLDIAMEVGITGWVCEHREAVVLADPNGDARFDSDGWVCEHREAVVLADPNGDARFDAEADCAMVIREHDQGEDFECDNLVAVPLLNHDASLLGVVVMLN
ncbi:GAF domain-like protein, partial [Baffinella frigidus]